nr:hypothetical protein Iba_chr07aCG7380 [Ipomoea batatas]
MAMAVCETMVATTFNAQANPYPHSLPKGNGEEDGTIATTSTSLSSVVEGHRVADCRKGKKDGDSGERREKKGDGPAAVAVMRKATTKEGGMGRQSEDGWLFTGR